MFFFPLIFLFMNFPWNVNVRSATPEKEKRKRMSSIVTESSNERVTATCQNEDDLALPLRMNQSEEDKVKESDRMSTESEEDCSDPKETSTSDGLSLPGNLRKALQRRLSSVLGSNSSHSNDSDNSALVSIGAGSFGFNFDCEEGINSDGKTNDSDSDGNSPPETKKGGGKSELITVESNSEGNVSSSNGDWKSSVSSLTQPSVSDYKGGTMSHDAAAAAAVANLHSIANSFSPTDKGDEGKYDASYGHGNWHPFDQLTMDDINFFSADSQSLTAENQPSKVSSSSLPCHGKRAAPESLDSGGYNSDGECTLSCSAVYAAWNVAISHAQNLEPMHMSTSHAYIESSGTNASSPHGISRKKGKKLDEEKREERNAREKERSFRISKKIDELRNLLSSGGVVVSKGTKSSVLTESANYIRLLQQHQYRSEM